MSSAINPLTGAMVAHGRRLDALSHDVANVSTAGHRATRTAFTLEGDTPRLETTVDATRGPLQGTGRELDVALAGEGYFVVEGPSGPALTRCGTLGVDAEGYLTVHGAPLQGTGGPIPRGQGRLVVAGDGTVVAGDEVVGQIRVVATAAPGARVGPGLFELPADAQDLEPSRVVVRQGHVEQSNLDVGRAGAEVATTLRDFETATRAFHVVVNDIVGQAVKDLGRF